MTVKNIVLWSFGEKRVKVVSLWLFLPFQKDNFHCFALLLLGERFYLVNPAIWHNQRTTQPNIVTYYNIDKNHQIIGLQILLNYPQVIISSVGYYIKTVGDIGYRMGCFYIRKSATMRISKCIFHLAFAQIRIKCLWLYVDRLLLITSTDKRMQPIGIIHLSRSVPLYCTEQKKRHGQPISLRCHEILIHTLPCVSAFL